MGWQEFGMQAANQGLGAVLGLASAGWQDRRQIKQQGKLQAMQEAGNKRMADYSAKKQLEMWEATGYGAQMRQLKEAGLNPGLMYGMSGGGGQSTGSAAAGGVSGGTAATGGGEVMQGVGMGIQGATAMASLELMKSQANKNNAEADATRGVQTDVGRAQVESLTQGVKNAKAVEALTKVQTSIAELDRSLKGETLDDQVEMVWASLGKLKAEMGSAMVQADVDSTTKETKMIQAKAELMNVVLRNTLTAGQVKKTEAEIEAIRNNVVQAIRSNNIEAFEAELKAAYPTGWEVLGGVMKRIFNWGADKTGQKKMLEKPKGE